MTRFMADHAAEELAKIAFDEKIKKAEKERLGFGDDLVRKYVPKPILELGKEYRSFFTINNCIFCHVESDGWGSSSYFSTNIENPTGKAVTISKSDYDKAKNLVRLCNELYDRKGDYQQQVSNALLNLKTEAKIKEQFPEALPFLNFTETNLPAVDYSNLRKLLK